MFAQPVIWPIVNASLNDPMFCRFPFMQMAAILASDGGDDADSDEEVEEEDEDPSQLQGPTHRSQASKVRDLRWHCMHASQGHIYCGPARLVCSLTGWRWSSMGGGKNCGIIRRTCFPGKPCESRLNSHPPPPPLTPPRTLFVPLLQSPRGGGTSSHKGGSVATFSTDAAGGPPIVATRARAHAIRSTRSSKRAAIAAQIKILQQQMQKL
jgi:hypothetical protein